MFAALCLLDAPADEPVSAWPARPRPNPGGVLLRLAPGVYIVRSRRWLPVAALDSHAELPPPELPELPPRPLPIPDWHADASCRGSGQTLYFGDGDGVRPALRRSVLARARLVCTPCKASHDCLTSALTQPEKYGIWGGTSGNDRKKLRARLRAGETVEDLVAEVLGD